VGLKLYPTFCNMTFACSCDYSYVYIFTDCVYGHLRKFPRIFMTIYEGKSLNNRNFILKCMEKCTQQKILFRDTKCLLSNMPYRGHAD
jgi:hypothetical protein